jgi:glycosyltransferase involved in cell wall biosynthesis
VIRPSVIISTYNQPRPLELVLWGYAVQTHRDFELLVADDGSGPETADVIERMRAETGLEIVHVWHEDDGFRKTEILNRAVLAARGNYLIFSDGDCIPRADFVGTHLRLARPGAFLSGGYLKLPAVVSEAITVDDVRSGRVTDLHWLREKGWHPGRHALRLVRSPALAALLDAVTTTKPHWKGNNASTWREACIRVNGFDLDMGYGGEDRAFGERLRNAGLAPKLIRFRAPTMHLDHPRPYQDPDIVQYNRAMVKRIRAERETRARHGLAELDSGVAPPEKRRPPMHPGVGGRGGGPPGAPRPHPGGGRGYPPPG